MKNLMALSGRNNDGPSTLSAAVPVDTQAHAAGPGEEGQTHQVSLLGAPSAPMLTSSRRRSIVLLIVRRAASLHSKHVPDEGIKSWDKP
ncbi:MAG: hypothetical protein E2592_04150 [Methylobacillus sp.]|nr:hypothetical protein [Methylobacillus sp.]